MEQFSLITALIQRLTQFSIKARRSLILARLQSFAVLKLTLFALFVMSCATPQQKAFKSASKSLANIQRLVNKYPELIDTLRLIYHDTIRVETARVSLDDNGANAFMWDSVTVSSNTALADSVVKSTGIKKPGALSRLQVAICPSVERDTTTFIKVFNNTVTRLVPIHISVRAKGSYLHVDVFTDEVKIPDNRVEKIATLNEVAPSFYKDQYFWIAVALLAILLLTLFSKRK